MSTNMISKTILPASERQNTVVNRYYLLRYKAKIPGAKADRDFKKGTSRTEEFGTTI